MKNLKDKLFAAYVGTVFLVAFTIATVTVLTY